MFISISSVLILLFDVWIEQPSLKERNEKYYHSVVSHTKNGTKIKKWLTDLTEEIKHGNVSQGSEFLMYLASYLIFAAACDDDAVVKYCGLSPSNLLKTGYLQKVFFLQAPLLTGGMAKRRGKKNGWGMTVFQSIMPPR